MNSKQKLKLFHLIEKYIIKEMNGNKYYTKNEIKNHADNILMKIINKPVETTNEQPINCAYVLKSNPEKVLIGIVDKTKDGFENIKTIEDFLKDKVIAYTFIG
jgi:hypothetical protein